MQFWPDPTSFYRSDFPLLPNSLCLKIGPFSRHSSRIALLYDMKLLQYLKLQASRSRQSRNRSIVWQCAVSVSWTSVYGVFIGEKVTSCRLKIASFCSSKNWRFPTFKDVFRAYLACYNEAVMCTFYDLIYMLLLIELIYVGLYPKADYCARTLTLNGVFQCYDGD